MHDILTFVLHVILPIASLACIISPVFAICGTIGILRGGLHTGMSKLDIFTSIFAYPTMITYYARWLIDETITFPKPFEFCGLIGMVLIIVVGIIESVKPRGNKC